MDSATYISQCRAEILALTAVQQAQAFGKASQQWQPLGEILYCATDTQAAAAALANGSCTADARFDHQCGANGCEEILMCSGSSANGRCYDDAGNFAGRVSGRDDNMLMKLGIAGAFSMSQSEQDFWRSWDPDTNEQQKCVYSRISSMNNLKIDDNSFSGIFSSKSKESCEAEAETKMALQGDGSESSDKGGGDEGMTIPFVATRK